jgi:hypothetical protein
MTSKAACHIELQENSVRKWVQDKMIKVVHVAGKTNPADTSTKEMWDGMHFCQLQESFMSRLSDFLSGCSFMAIHHAWHQSPTSGVPAAAWVSLSSGDSPLLLPPSFGLSPTSLICQVLVGSSFGELLASSPHLFCDILPSIYPWESSHIFPFAVMLGIYSDGATMSLASAPERKIVQHTSTQFP